MLDPPSKKIKILSTPSLLSYHPPNLQLKNMIATEMLSRWMICLAITMPMVGVLDNRVK